MRVAKVLKEGEESSEPIQVLCAPCAKAFMERMEALGFTVVMEPRIWADQSGVRYTLYVLGGD